MMNLKGLADRGTRLTLQRRIELCEDCIHKVFTNAGRWTKLAVQAKGLSSDSPLQAEDILSGPTVVCRQLRLSLQTLKRLQTSPYPALPGTPKKLNHGQLSIPVFPARGLFDPLTFMGLRASVRMQPGVEPEQIHGGLLDKIRTETILGTTAILGAGNVSAIPATDTLNAILFENKTVALKLNPVNEYLAPVFEDVFAPFIQEGLLKIFTGDGSVGAQLIHEDQVTDIHITGATQTHDAIVWGTGDDATKRKAADRPLLQKTITSELGNVTPWIIYPAVYSQRELESQAQHVTASITNNASFNCLATKVIITWKSWPQRQRFLKLVQHYLDQTPTRPAYYPGAHERFEKYAGHPAETKNDHLPWTLLTDQSIKQRPELFEEESFVCVCAETALESSNPQTFLEEAVEFANDRLSGTLCASLTVPQSFRKRNAALLENCLQQLKYGSICLNQWSGLAYGLISPPWGAYPGATLQNVQSGIGSVHNTYLLDNYEKTVLEGPLINFPKPIWFSNHSNGISVARRLLSLYHRSTLLKLPALFAAALRG